MNRGEGSQSRLSVWLGRYLCALAWVLPFVVIYAFVRPMVGQSYFLQAGVCLGLVVAGGAWLLGAWAPSVRLTYPLALLPLNILLLAGSVLHSRDPQYSLAQSLLPLCAAGFFLLLVMQAGRERLLRRLALGLCIVGPLLALHGVLQHFGIEFLPYSDVVQKNRVIATIGHPNYLGSVLGPLLFVMVGLILAHPRRAWAWAAPLGVLLMLVCLALARTRAIWLGLAVGFILFCVVGVQYCRAHRAGLRRMLLLIAGGVAQLAAIIVLLTLILPHISDLNWKERLSSDKEIKSRLFYWDTAIRLGHARPVFGQGLGMFNAKFWETALERYKSPSGPYYSDILPSIAGVMPGHVHNEYLEIYCEQGLTGLAGVLALLLFFLWFGYRALLAEPDLTRGFELLGVWAGLVVSVIDALFGFPWRLPVSLMVVAFLLARLYDLLYPQVERVAAANAASQPVPAAENGTA
jgi:O-antigen ligase